ncbi:hypothetical protein B0H14DRAFT_2331828, partial [Mycena olivaceomarginata]
IPYCDVRVSSLTKLFSGMGNVICGAMMLNPASRFYDQFKAHMDATYEDSFFDSDALVLEMNSREFITRTAATNYNTENSATALFPLGGWWVQKIHHSYGTIPGIFFDPPF